MLKEHIRRQARQELVRIDVRDVINDADSFIKFFGGKVPDWLQNELALDGIKLIYDEGCWYVGPLDA